MKMFVVIVEFVASPALLSLILSSEESDTLYNALLWSLQSKSRCHRLSMALVPDAGPWWTTGLNWVMKWRAGIQSSKMGYLWFAADFSLSQQDQTIDSQLH